jgi:hypothetical protein
MKTELTKTIKFFLFAIIGILISCNSSNNKKNQVNVSEKEIKID